jgi:hypothetical protein
LVTIVFSSYTIIEKIIKPKPGGLGQQRDFFVATGEKTRAIEMFNKALSIKENAETINKLNKLLK